MLALVMVGSALLIALGLGKAVWLGHRLNGRYAGRLDDLHTGACWRGGYASSFWHGRHASFPPR